MLMYVKYNKNMIYVQEINKQEFTDNILMTFI